MPIHELTKDCIRGIEESKFAELGFSERGDLQRLLRDQVDVISPDTLVIAEEYGDWQDSRRRIDLLGLDKVSPEAITEVVAWRRATMFRVVDGIVGTEHFVRLAAEKAKAEGRRFDPRRYFVDDEDLIVAENRTYAFTNQWGNRTCQAIDLLNQAFPDTEISYVKSS